MQQATATSATLLNAKSRTSSGRVNIAAAVQGSAGRTSKRGDQLSDVEVVFSTNPYKQFTMFVCQDILIIKQWLTRGERAKKARNSEPLGWT